MIYLDNAATTKPSQAVVEAMMDCLQQDYGNPSSTYTLGRLAKTKLEQARKDIAQFINAKPSDIIFTSGGTESNNTALYSLARMQPTKKQIISSTIEHPSIKEVLHDLQTKGYTIILLPVDETGCVSLNDLKEAVSEQTCFVTIMSVNNETGMKQPIEEIAHFLKEQHIPFHTDAVQAFGNQRLDMQTLPITMMSVSGHKIHGPKGIGFLYVRENTPYTPFLLGGGQENRKRSGTENLPSIVGLSTAVSQLQLEQRLHHFDTLQQYLLKRLNQSGVQYAVNGDLSKKDPKIINIWLKNIASSKLLIQLDLHGVMISAGSACSAGSLKPSSVLLAMFSDCVNRASESIRLSFSEETTLKDLDTLVEILVKCTV